MAARSASLCDSGIQDGRAERQDRHALATFGKNGIVDLKDDDDQAIDPMSSEIGLHSAPIDRKMW